MSRRGVLIAIGGGEDRNGEREILAEVCRRVNGPMVVATVASHQPDGHFAEYERIFQDLGMKDLRELYIHERSEAASEEKLKVFEGAGGVFFSGGDQLRIASQIGDTPVEQCIREIFKKGGVVAGTSAGASIMGSTMLVRGSSSESYRIGDLHMAPGIGLAADMIIDQHFAERGRMSRLLGAVAHNPRMLGIGIDEDTAIVIEGPRFRVLGDGAIYVIDACAATHSNIAEAEPDNVLSLHGVALHVLSSGDTFDMKARQPIPRPEKK